MSKEILKNVLIDHTGELKDIEIANMALKLGYTMFASNEAAAGSVLSTLEVIAAMKMAGEKNIQQEIGILFDYESLL